LKRNVKVGIWGFGAMGSGMAQMLLKKKGIEVVSVCDRNPQRAGKSMYDVLDMFVYYFLSFLLFEEPL